MVSKGLILIVDEQPTTLETLRVLLESFGYAVVDADNNADALEIARQGSLSLVLSDVRMPGTDGTQLVQRLKTDPACRDVPVVLITESNDVLGRARGLDAGADDFLSKPVEAAELALRVRAHVRLRHFQRESAARAQLLAEPGTIPVITGGGRILVVEDDAEYRGTLVRYLEVDGHCVNAVGDLRSAHNLLDTEDHDVVVVDFSLPDGSGDSLTERFGGAQLENRMTAVVVVTGADGHEARLRALRWGADDYLVKPVVPEELRARMMAQLRRSRSSRALKEQVVLARHAAATDGLTGLYNRRHLDRDLADRVARAQASGHGFALVLIDLDHFKRINDEYGHGVGDLVLREVSDAVRAGIRVTDTAFRYGGEELCIVLPGTPAREALGCVERIRQRVVSRAFGPVTRGAVTFSAGLADWSDGDTPQNLLDRADRTLFRAKDSGRNTARVALEDRDE